MRKSSANSKKINKVFSELASQITPEGELVRSSARHSERCSECEWDMNKKREKNRKTK